MQWKKILDSHQHSNQIKPEQTWQTPLDDYRLIIVEGEDSETFLQGQCTCDFALLERNIFIPGAHCSHKGRMNSNFVAARLNTKTIALRVRADISQFALEALKKYAVFSKATLQVSESYQLLGLVGDQALTTATHIFPVSKAGEVVEHNNIFMLHHADDQIELWCPSNELSQLVEQLGALELQQNSNLWRLKNIQRGIGEVEAATLEKLIPQEINLQYIDGISFKKGCYTGQEIIARLHYRGQQKKHMYRAVIETAVSPEANTAVYQSPVNIEALGKARGTVINSARVSPSHHEILVLCDDVLSQDNACIMINNSLVNIQWAALPYAIS
ncbi:YgfZ/GcvT domain-containing protein [Agarilytica rhodophyticola]|uniref:CAF17-like 4Fe-4S cluster assembly/insertion protein YgfZ n=1 Tax=Agarilytica rhodophyticola TaxID=1737490 RepID=UPI000B34978B|nr:folate-binding protein YgfZ [Agarilytica rhodophyticola]